ncbi:MAG TPA: ComEC/Rec2 family competence protein [Candidatus Saccharibacteria bacterium]|nr:ComEC/Rec2 family competence protein [Candidatus Saccharibacteria bacterium]
MNWWALKRRIHVSWLIATIAAGCVVGVALAADVPAGWFSHCVWVVVALTLLAIVFCFRYIAMIVLCLLGGMIIGLWRGGIDRVDLMAYQQILGHMVEIRGVVREDIDQRVDGQYVMKVSSIVYGEMTLPGVVWVTFTTNNDVRRSDVVTVRGKISEGFGNFPASIYRADIVRVERPEPGDVALRVRDAFGKSVRSVVPEPQVSLGLGYLLGQRRALPEELGEALRVAGLTHIIVASGYNLTILVRFARRIFMRISRYMALIMSSGLVLGFIAVTGMSPSMSRAGLVTGLSLLAWYYGRKFHPLVLLPVAAAVTVLINPSYAWGDVGWQLSFAAFAGVMIVAPLLQSYFFGDKKPGAIRQIMGETISAQLATLPIIIMVFGQMSNVALIANLLVLPLVPLAMLLVFITGLSAMTIPFLGAALAVPTTWLLGYMTSTATYLANLPWAMTDVDVGGWVLLLYGVIIGACVYVHRVTQLSLKDHSIVD